MNVHVVCTAYGKNRPESILPRHARYLHENLGWNMGRKPDPEADVNYFLPFTNGWKHWGPWHETYTAAFFTHKEPYGAKRGWWDEAREHYNLRICNAPMYYDDLIQHGPTELVQHCVEVSHFTLTPREYSPETLPVIGLNGFVNLGGRKGELLVYQLNKYAATGHFRIKASGQGWPIESKWYRWKDLPSQFYHSLDLLLCTSLVDAGPGGPLEALSCGIPVVIPSGVGIMDELPNVHGVYRYPRGNFDEMCGTILRCITELGTHDKRKLRAITRDMTIETFCTNHRRIFEKHFGGGEDVAIPVGDIPGGQAE